MKALNLIIRLLILIILSNTIIETPIIAYAQQQAIFEDNFVDNRYNWPLWNNPQFLAKVQNGKYYLEQKRTNDKFLSWISHIDINQDQDFQIDATIERIHGPMDGYTGIVWGLKDKSFHEFGLSPGGYYWYGKVINNQWHDIKSATRFQAINEQNSTNILSIKKTGDQIRFLINGKLAHSTKFQKFFGNGIGFMIWNNTAIEIKNISIRYSPLENVLNVEKPTPLPKILEKRIALVIGNSQYKEAPLQNPVNDARAIEIALQRLGFDVMRYENASQREMKKAIDTFGHRLKNYQVGLFFYSGHGAQVKGENYLIPVDTVPTSENDVEYDCVNAERVLGKMEDAGSKVNIIILDACRNNPFEKSWTKSTKGKGLAFMNAPTGSLIAYATSPGNVAFDDPSKQNSPYTSALLHYLERPDITILQMFQFVRKMVIQETEKQQTPWESTSLIGDFYLSR